MLIHINKYTPLSAYSYVKFPTDIAKKGAILNIKNDDLICFARSVNASIFNTRDQRKTSSYLHYNTLLNFT